jgi:hypothetical protein
MVVLDRVKEIRVVWEDGTADTIVDISNQETIKGIFNLIQKQWEQS